MPGEEVQDRDGEDRGEDVDMPPVWLKCALPLIREATPQLIEEQEIVSVQAMPSPVGGVAFFKPRFGETWIDVWERSEGMMVQHRYEGYIGIVERKGDMIHSVIVRWLTGQIGVREYSWWDLKPASVVDALATLEEDDG